MTWDDWPYWVIIAVLWAVGFCLQMGVLHHLGQHDSTIRGDLEAYSFLPYLFAALWPIIVIIALLRKGNRKNERTDHPNG